MRTSREAPGSDPGRATARRAPRGAARPARGARPSPPPRTRGVVAARGGVALVAAELGAVAAQTVLVALLPVLLARAGATPLWIGLAVGGEGAFALLLPFWAGAASDRAPAALAARFGRRMVVAAPAAVVLAGAVAIAPFLPGYVWMAVAAFFAFAGLHAFLTPFWALLVDGVPAGRRARVQGVRGMFRSAGLAYGLAAAGLLFAAWPPLPFLVAAALVLVTTAVTWSAERAASGEPRGARRGTLRESWRVVVTDPAALWLLLADALWNASVDGIRPYVFLYARHALGIEVSRTSLGLALLVASLAAASWGVGRLGDRLDRSRLLVAASAILALAFAAGFVARSVAVVLAIAVSAGAAAAAIMTLPFPLFTSIVGDHGAGENTGIYEVSVTLGRVASPLLVGAVIEAAARHGMPGRGYPAMWLVASALAAGGGLCAWRSARARRVTPSPPA